MPGTQWHAKSIFDIAFLATFFGQFKCGDYCNHVLLSFKIKSANINWTRQTIKARENLLSFSFHAAVKTKLVVTQNTYSVLICEKLNNLCLAYHESSGAQSGTILLGIYFADKHSLNTRLVKHRSNKLY